MARMPIDAGSRAGGTGGRLGTRTDGARKAVEHDVDGPVKRDVDGASRRPKGKVSKFPTLA
jgi:hypothetical protein